MKIDLRHQNLIAGDDRAVCAVKITLSTPSLAFLKDSGIAHPPSTSSP